MQPAATIYPSCATQAAPPNPVLFDVSPSEKLLGVQYKTTEEMVHAAVTSLLENGLDSTAKYAHAVAK